MKSIVIIPARYASTRFPGKPLAMIHGKPMIQWVYENSKKAKSVSAVYVATDDDRIMDVVNNFGGEVLLTRPDHSTGTDRIMEAYENLDLEFDVVINVQGDEPYVDPEHIDTLIESFRDEQVKIATLIKPYNVSDDVFDENKIRVVVNKKGKALYFSRAAIPFVKNEENVDWVSKASFYQHIGMYAYRPKTLNEITKLSPSNLEVAESLEQLRWLENGYDIQTVLTDTEGFSIDTPEDLDKLLKL